MFASSRIKVTAQQNFVQRSGAGRLIRRPAPVGVSWALLSLIKICAGIGALSALSACDHNSSDPSITTPNILFVIMDDVGIDQLQRSATAASIHM